MVSVDLLLGGLDAIERVFHFAGTHLVEMELTVEAVLLSLVRPLERDALGVVLAEVGALNLLEREVDSTRCVGPTFAHEVRVEHRQDAPRDLLGPLDGVKVKEPHGEGLTAALAFLRGPILDDPGVTRKRARRLLVLAGRHDQPRAAQTLAVLAVTGNSIQGASGTSRIF